MTTSIVGPPQVLTETTVLDVEHPFRFGRKATIHFISLHVRNKKSLKLCENTSTELEAREELSNFSVVTYYLQQQLLQESYLQI